MPMGTHANRYALKLPPQVNLERSHSPLTSVTRTYQIAHNYPKLTKLNFFSPRNFTKNDHRYKIFFNLSSRQQYFSDDMSEFRQKQSVK